MHFTDDSGLVHEGFVEVAALTSGSKVEGVAVLEERNGQTAAQLARKTSHVEVAPLIDAQV